MKMIRRINCHKMGDEFSAHLIIAFTAAGVDP
jgi:hypothetical protein